METFLVAENFLSSCKITAIPVVNPWSGERMGVLLTTPELAKELVKSLAEEQPIVTSNFNADGSLESISFASNGSLKTL